MSSISGSTSDHDRRAGTGVGRAATRALRNLVAVIAAAVVAACATPIATLRAPTVHVETVRVAVNAGARVRFFVVLSVYNPNSFPLTIQALDARVMSAGDDLAKISLDQPVTLRATANERFDIEVEPDFPAITRAGDRAARDRMVPYELTGRATLGDGTVVPFYRVGDFPISALAGLERRQ